MPCYYPLTIYFFIILLNLPSSNFCTYTCWGTILKFLKHFESACQTHRPQVASKANCKNVNANPCCPFYCTSCGWFQVTESSATHLQAWQLHVPAAAMCPLSFKWLTCFLFASHGFEFTKQTACQRLDSKFSCVEIKKQEKPVRERERLMRTN